jgi:hypothetical protein
MCIIEQMNNKNYIEAKGQGMELLSCLSSILNLCNIPNIDCYRKQKIVQLFFLMQTS